MISHSSDLLRDEGIKLDEVLLLIPGGEGAESILASTFPAITEKRLFDAMHLAVPR